MQIGFGRHSAVAVLQREGAAPACVTLPYGVCIKLAETVLHCAAIKAHRQGRYNIASTDALSVARLPWRSFCQTECVLVCRGRRSGRWLGCGSFFGAAV